MQDVVLRKYRFMLTFILCVIGGVIKKPTENQRGEGNVGEKNWMRGEGDTTNSPLILEMCSEK